MRPKPVRCDNCRYEDEPCNACKRERERRDRINRQRRARDEAIRSLGMTKVRGCVSGETYWE